MLAACRPAPHGGERAGLLPPALPDAALVATNEPFWQARIDGKAMRVTGFATPERLYAVIAVRDDGAGRHWIARDGADTVTASVAPVPCLDSLSGQPLPFLATLAVNGRTAGGCARAAGPDPAPEIPAAFAGRWGPNPLGCEDAERDPDGLTIAPRALTLRGETGVPDAVAAPTLDRAEMRLEADGRAVDATLHLDASGRHLTLVMAGETLNRLRCSDS